MSQNKQIGCESFPMPQSDVPQPVFSTDLYGKLRFLQVDGLVRQNTCQIVERRKSYRSISA
jgi:hypothetical protein